MVPLVYVFLSEGSLPVRKEKFSAGHPVSATWLSLGAEARCSAALPGRGSCRCQAAVWGR